MHGPCIYALKSPYSQGNIKTLDQLLGHFLVGYLYEQIWKVSLVQASEQWRHSQFRFDRGGR